MDGTHLFRYERIISTSPQALRDDKPSTAKLCVLPVSLRFTRVDGAHLFRNEKVSIFLTLNVTEGSNAK